MNKSLVSTIIFTAFGALPLAANADMGGYFGGGVGYAQIDGEEIFDDGDVNFEDDRMTWQLYGGMKFTPNIGLEANYIDFDEASDSGVVFASDGFGLAVVGHLPISDYFTLSGRLGQLWWDLDATASTDNFDVDFSDSGSDIFYGVDARFGRADGGLGFVFKYDRYEVGSADINVPSVNLELGF